MYFLIFKYAFDFFQVLLFVVGNQTSLVLSLEGRLSYQAQILPK